MTALQSAAARPEASAVVTKAVLRAAEQLGVTARILATVIGVSEATVSRMKRGEFGLEPGTKPFELAVLFVRLFRSLDAIAGGDEKVAASWLANPNAVLDARPIEKLQTVSGLVDVIAYLDARRALV
ncbi:antitoxin Xre-like helix-turn-helix domain-containing protein [Roseixanthobacter pseudopolyaromaticivorans]|uniref:antitoxin Xre-like helix-turn-helix domain-containing protein n=1 Tax=Xanthobacteraceae TaxID=335928 RepID=UPI00372C0A9C